MMLPVRRNSWVRVVTSHVSSLAFEKRMFVKPGYSVFPGFLLKLGLMIKISVFSFCNVYRLLHLIESYPII